MPRGLRTTLRVTVGTLVVAALLALTFLIVAQSWPGAGNAHIQWYGHATPLDSVFDHGTGQFLLAWGAVTLGMLIMIAAIIFAIVVSVMAFAFTGIALGATALLLALPLIIVAAIVWFVVRQSERTTARGNATVSAQS